MSFPRCVLSLRSTAFRLLPALLLLAATAPQLPAQEKKAVLPPELAVIPDDAIGFLYLRPADLWSSEPAAKLRKLFPLHTLGLLKMLDENPADTESLIAFLPAQDGKVEKPGNSLNNIVLVETASKPVAKEKLLQQLLGEGAVKKSQKKRSYYMAKEAAGPRTQFFALSTSGAIHFLNDRTYIFTFTAETMERTLAGLDRPTAAGPLSPALDLAHQKHQAVFGVSATWPIAETLAELLREIAPAEFALDRVDLDRLAQDLIPDGDKLWNVKSAAISLDVNKEIRLEGELAYADERTAARAAPALQDLFTLVRLAPCRWAHAELRRRIQSSDDSQPFALLDVLLSQAESALRKPAVEQKQATVKFALRTQLDVDALDRAAKLRAKNVAREDFAFIHARVAEMAKTELGVELLKLSPEMRMMISSIEEMGLPLKEMESVTVVLPTSRSLQFGIGLPAPRAEPLTAPPGGKKMQLPADPLPPSGRPKIDDEKKKSEDKKDFDKKSDGSAFVESQPGRGRGGSTDDELFMVLVKTAKPIDRARLVKSVLGLTEKDTERRYRGKSYYTRPGNLGGEALHFVDDRTVLVVPESNLMPLAFSHWPFAEAKGPLAQAVELAQKKHHLVVGVNLTESSVIDTKRLLREALRRSEPEMLEWVFFESLLPLLEAQSLLLTADLGKEVRIQAEVGFANPEQAAAAVEAAEDGLAMARLFFLSSIRSNLKLEAQSIIEDDSDPGPIVFGSTILVPGEKAVLVPRRDLKPTFVTEAILVQADTFLRKATVEQKAATLKVLTEGKIDAAGLMASARQNALAFIKSQENELNMTKSIRNLSTIVGALQSYQEVHGKFPKSGKLSWRVHILPFMDELALYQEFKLDEAWDSPHNIKLLPRMPKVFASPGIKSKEPFTTPYQMFTGKGSFLENGKLQANDERLALAEAEAVPWTKPGGDLIVDAKKPAPRFGGVFAEGFHVAFSSGRVQFLFADDAAQVVRSLLARPIDEKKDEKKE